MTILIETSQFTAIVLQLDIWRIANDDIEPIGKAEHPFYVKEWTDCVLVVGVPCCQLFSTELAFEVFRQKFCQFTS